ncbi:hypothetical protein Q786_03580 [Salmonella enterica subsp. enterica serovar Agona str. 24249]|uniref:Uncharacterized protein n=1 Tax=Salmonella typhimurium (strain 14028s / SGSC 2262) TaxID=588858 RepID=A0A0F6AYP1_SALT1|nr:hypothetical protein STM14_0860 [Salmonella enterica subsp. enterica serovar Typhimurium str. 14028S]AHB43477.1 hypothetical protein Q786_03580 [Salmonella enterica subsp. enterica serovar Agona str. 24249]
MPQYKFICGLPSYYPLGKETVMMKSYKHVNKKPKLIPQIYYAVKPLQ